MKHYSLFGKHIVLVHDQAKYISRYVCIFGKEITSEKEMSQCADYLVMPAYNWSDIHTLHGRAALNTRLKRFAVKIKARQIIYSER